MGMLSQRRNQKSTNYLNFTLMDSSAPTDSGEQKGVAAVAQYFV
jgi:hypothetical protein